MPWKGEKDPYKIWLSEIILQQTRVEQGLKYYQNFIKTFPDINKLAKASDTRIFKLWEGLGYYTRCKNLIATARFVSSEKKGKFPDTYEDILALKGVGPYTAAAIASFAFNLPHAVLDGNVFRVLSRYFGISTAFDSPEGRKLYARIAHELLDKKQPGIYNQAIMDLGATICKPQQPLCNQCPQHKDCQAYKHDWTKQLPVKEKQLSKTTRWFYYLIINIDDDVLIRKRTAKDIWENLYEFVLYETEKSMIADKETIQLVCKKLFGKTKFTIKNISEIYNQQLTHQTIIGQFIELDLVTIPASLDGYKRIQITTLKKYPFPRIIAFYLQQKTKPILLY